MKLIRINHLGLASASLQHSMDFMKRVFDQEPNHEETVPDQKVKTAFFQVGESRLEFLETTDPEGPIGRFIKKRGAAMHHVCLEVDDIEAALVQLKAKGIRLIDEHPRQGAHGCRVAFIHPSETPGVLMELSEESKPTQLQA